MPTSTFFSSANRIILKKLGFKLGSRSTVVLSQYWPSHPSAEQHFGDYFKTYLRLFDRIYVDAQAFGQLHGGIELGQLTGFNGCLERLVDFLHTAQAREWKDFMR